MRNITPVMFYTSSTCTATPTHIHSSTVHNFGQGAVHLERIQLLKIQFPSSNQGRILKGSTAGVRRLNDWIIKVTHAQVIANLFNTNVPIGFA